ncbi:MAG: HlyC/CorC family transporter [Pseudomonadales bacterium]|nr:HlyC/CorC family transporter [Pseudomonadales bacterium]
MSEISSSLLLLSLLFLVLASAYFSGSETAMMALNKYRLRHLVKQKNKGAINAARLLGRPDRLLGVILIGNNLVNNLAAAIATVIGLRYFGDSGIVAAPFVMTLLFLVFAEVAPKTLAAENPERFAFPSTYILKPLLWLMYPFVFVINILSNRITSLISSPPGTPNQNDLSLPELRTVVDEAVGENSPERRMLLKILDLEQVTVNDIMVPRNEIDGICIDDDLPDIVDQISTSQHTRMPVHRENINDIVGMLHMRGAMRFMHEEQVTKEALLKHTHEAYFVPEGTPLHTQLVNFQNEKRRIALVVDEYGDLQGIVTLEDILEEIVGEFTTDFAGSISEIHPQEDGSYYIDGSALLRDINRALSWEIPIGGPRTLNGLILENLEFIPEQNVCLQIHHYRIETLQIRDHVVTNVRIWQIEPTQQKQHRQQFLRH